MKAQEVIFVCGQNTLSAISRDFYGDQKSRDLHEKSGHKISNQVDLKSAAGIITTLSCMGRFLTPPMSQTPESGDSPWCPGHRELWSAGIRDTRSCVATPQLFFFCLEFFPNFKPLLLTLKQQPIIKESKSIIYVLHVFTNTFDSCLNKFPNFITSVTNPGVQIVVFKPKKLHDFFSFFSNGIRKYLIGHGETVCWKRKKNPKNLMPNWPFKL